MIRVFTKFLLIVGVLSFSGCGDGMSGFEHNKSFNSNKQVGVYDDTIN